MGEDPRQWIRNILQATEGRIWEEPFTDVGFCWTSHRPTEWGKGGEEDDSEEEPPRGGAQADEEDKEEEEGDFEQPDSARD